MDASFKGSPANKGDTTICYPNTSSAYMNLIGGRCSPNTISATGTFGGQTWIRNDCRDSTNYVALNTPAIPLNGYLAQSNGITDLDSSSILAPPTNVASGTILNVGQSISIGAASQIVMQGDGNLVVYTPSGPVWSLINQSQNYLNGATYSSNTSCGSCYAAFQTDGNIVVYNPAFNGNSTHAIWALSPNSNSGLSPSYQVAGVSPYVLAYDSGAQYWSGNTLGTWRANGPFSHHGSGGSATGNAWQIAADGNYQILTYGPYATGLPSGNLKAVFQLQVDNNSANNEAIADVDVYRYTTNTQFAHMTITRQQFGAPNIIQNFELPFTYDGSGELEFRVFVYGDSYVKHAGTYVLPQ